MIPVDLKDVIEEKELDKENVFNLNNNSADLKKKYHNEECVITAPVSIEETIPQLDGHVDLSSSDETEESILQLDGKKKYHNEKGVSTAPVSREETIPQFDGHVDLSSSDETEESIPQLDGNISSEVSHCSNSQKVLRTIDDYKWHYETKHGREDCRLLRSMLN